MKLWEEMVIMLAYICAIILIIGMMCMGAGII